MPFPAPKHSIPTLIGCTHLGRHTQLYSAAKHSEQTQPPKQRTNPLPFALKDIGQIFYPIKTTSLILAEKQ